MKFVLLLVVSAFLTQGVSFASPAPDKKIITIQGTRASQLYSVLVNDLLVRESQGINSNSIRLTYLDVVLRVTQVRASVVQRATSHIMDANQIPVPAVRTLETLVEYEIPSGEEPSLVTEGHPAAKLYSVLKSIGIHSYDSKTTDVDGTVNDEKVMYIPDLTCSIGVHQQPTCTLEGNGI